MDALPNFMFTHFKILLFVMKLLFPLEVIVLYYGECNTSGANILPILNYDFILPLFVRH